MTEYNRMFREAFDRIEPASDDKSFIKSIVERNTKMKTNDGFEVRELHEITVPNIDYKPRKAPWIAAAAGFTAVAAGIGFFAASGFGAGGGDIGTTPLNGAGWSESAEEFPAIGIHSYREDESAYVVNVNKAFNYELCTVTVWDYIFDGMTLRMHYSIDHRVLPDEEYRDYPVVQPYTTGGDAHFTQNTPRRTAISDDGLHEEYEAELHSFAPTEGCKAVFLDSRTNEQFRDAINDGKYVDITKTFDTVSVSSNVMSDSFDIDGISTQVLRTHICGETVGMRFLMNDLQDEKALDEALKEADITVIADGREIPLAEQEYGRGLLNYEIKNADEHPDDIMWVEMTVPLDEVIDPLRVSEIVVNGVQVYLNETANLAPESTTNVAADEEVNVIRSFDYDGFTVDITGCEFDGSTANVWYTIRIKDGSGLAFTPYTSLTDPVVSKREQYIIGCDGERRILAQTETEQMCVKVYRVSDSSQNALDHIDLVFLPYRAEGVTDDLTEKYTLRVSRTDSTVYPAFTTVEEPDPDKIVNIDGLKNRTFRFDGFTVDITGYEFDGHTYNLWYSEIIDTDSDITLGHESLAYIVPGLTSPYGMDGYGKALSTAEKVRKKVMICELKDSDGNIEGVTSEYVTLCFLPYYEESGTKVEMNALMKQNEFVLQKNTDKVTPAFPGEEKTMSMTCVQEGTDSLDYNIDGRKLTLLSKEYDSRILKLQFRSDDIDLEDGYQILMFADKRLPSSTSDFDRVTGIYTVWAEVSVPVGKSVYCEPMLVKQGDIWHEEDVFANYTLPYMYDDEAGTRVFEVKQDMHEYGLDYILDRVTVTKFGVILDITRDSAHSELHFITVTDKDGNVYQKRKFLNQNDGKEYDYTAWSIYGTENRLLCIPQEFDLDLTEMASININGFEISLI